MRFAFVLFFFTCLCLETASAASETMTVKVVGQCDQYFLNLKTGPEASQEPPKNLVCTAKVTIRKGKKPVSGRMLEFSERNSSSGGLLSRKRTNRNGVVQFNFTRDDGSCYWYVFDKKRAKSVYIMLNQYEGGACGV